MVGDLHKKNVRIVRREKSGRERRSMEGTLKIAMELLKGEGKGDISTEGR